jgi:hypothetical protein
MPGRDNVAHCILQFIMSTLQVSAASVRISGRRDNFPVLPIVFDCVTCQVGDFLYIRRRSSGDIPLKECTSLIFSLSWSRDSAPVINTETGSDPDKVDCFLNANPIWDQSRDPRGPTIPAVSTEEFDS